MEITSSIINTAVPVTVVRVNGNIDSSSHQAFLAEVERLLAQGAGRILVDLAGSPFISSAGLRALHQIFNQLRTLHRDVDDEALRRKMNTGAYKSPYLKVLNLSREAREVFELGGFDTYIEVHDNEEKAIASFY
jgi:anti-anti-sigma factor